MISNKIVNCDKYELNNNYIRCKNDIELIINKLNRVNQWNINIVLDINTHGSNSDIKFYNNNNNKCELTLNINENGEICYRKQQQKQ